MPLDIEITYDDGSKSLAYIPLSIMRGEKDITNYNDFIKPIKTTYYSINSNVLGCIIKNFEEEHLSLISEIWYIGDYNKKIREFKISFDPNTNKNKWIENRYR